jgi:hypothetical protein
MNIRRTLPRLAFCLSIPLALAPAAACGGDDDGGASDAGPADASGQVDAARQADADLSADATPADLACLGDPLPTSAPATVSVSGEVFTLQQLQQQPVSGALVSARRLNNVELDTDTTGADGLFTVSASTNNKPLNAYLYATKAGFLPTREYPPTPIAGDLTDAPVPLLTQALLDALAVFAGQVDQDPANGVMFVVAADCSGNPIEGATISSEPAAGTVVYGDDDGFPDVNATSTGAQGLVFLFNVPPGAVVVDADVNGSSLREHTVRSVGGEITATAVLP